MDNESQVPITQENLEAEKYEKRELNNGACFEYSKNWCPPRPGHLSIMDAGRLVIRFGEMVGEDYMVYLHLPGHAVSLPQIRTMGQLNSLFELLKRPRFYKKDLENAHSKSPSR
jgi:hypothetical protein